MGIVILYLLAIVLANLSVTLFGPQFAVFNSFVFIGLDLTSRDALHERWQHKKLILKMGALIASGSILSWVLNRNAGLVAIASFVAFATAGLVDTITYHALGKYDRFLKMNGSNIAAAIVDTIIFVVIAFGKPILWEIIILAIVAKIAGGLFWSLVVAWSYNRNVDPAA